MTTQQKLTIEDSHVLPASGDEEVQAMNTQDTAPVQKKRQNRKKKGSKKAIEATTLTTHTASSASGEATLPAPFMIGPHFELRSIAHKVSVEPYSNEQETEGNCPEAKDTHGQKDEAQENEDKLFATVNTPAGTRIISEPPIITLSATASKSVSDICSAFYSLTPTRQSAFMDLKPAAALQYHEMSTVIDQLIDIYFPLHSKFESGEGMTEREHDVYKELGRRIQSLVRAWRIAARFHAHCHSLTNIPISEREHIPAHIPVTGLFLIATRLQHSCMPNCHAMYNPSTGVMNVHAVRTIAVGETLTISAIGNHIWYQDAKCRADLLAENFVYSCACPACNSDHPNYHRLHHLRLELHLNTVFLQAFITAIDTRENRVAYKAKLKDHSSFLDEIVNDVTDHQDLLDAEDKLLQSLEILQNLGCQDTELSRWRNALRDIVYPRLSQPENALVQAKVAFEEAVKCWGRDHPDIGSMESGIKIWETVLDKRRKAREKEQADIRKKMFEKGKAPGKKRPR
jgi:hypothetical protein